MRTGGPARVAIGSDGTGGLVAARAQAPYRCGCRCCGSSVWLHLIAVAEAQQRSAAVEEVTAIITERKPERLAKLYQELGISLRCEIAEGPCYATAPQLDQL